MHQLLWPKLSSKRAAFKPKSKIKLALYPSFEQTQTKTNQACFFKQYQKKKAVRNIDDVECAENRHHQ